MSADLESNPLSALARLQRRAPADPMRFTVSARPSSLQKGLAAEDFVLLCGCAAALLLLLVAYLAQSASITRQAYTVQGLQATLERVEHENRLLRVEIARLEDLRRIETRAAELGFGTPERIHYLRLPEESSHSEAALSATAARAP